MKVGAWALRERILQGGCGNINRAQRSNGQLPEPGQVCLGMDIPTLRALLASR